jgi:hypothetical protein
MPPVVVVPVSGSEPVSAPITPAAPVSAVLAEEAIELVVFGKN